MKQRRLILFCVLLAVVGLSHGGCVRQPSETSNTTPEPLPKPVATQRPKAEPIPAETLTIVLSDEGEASRAVADQIRTRSGSMTREVVLGGKTSAQTLALLSNDQGPIIALGLEAAQTVAPLAKKRTVVFSLVFNFRDHQLLEQGLIGVSMLPSPNQVMSLLRELNVGEIQLAMPTGAGMHDYSSLVRTAANSSRIELITTEVGSDKELLHFASRLPPTVKVFWLLPDNRILSREVLQKLIAENIKNGRQSIVFTSELFAFGGLISARFSAPAIADTVLSITKKGQTERIRLRGTLLQPKTSTLQINAELAKTLGLKIPVTRNNLIRPQK